MKAFVLALLVASTLPAQTSPRVMRYGIVEPRLRDSLETFWDTTASAVERGLCITGWFKGGKQYPAQKGPPTGDTAYVVLVVSPPDTIMEATPLLLRYGCHGANVPTIHTHTPTTCDDFGRNCVVGGLEAFQCHPSRGDYVSLILSGAPFGVVRCGPRHYVFYYPADVRPEPLRWQPKRVSK